MPDTIQLGRAQVADRLDLGIIEVAVLGGSTVVAPVPMYGHGLTWRIERGSTAVTQPWAQAVEPLSGDEVEQELAQYADESMELAEQQFEVSVETWPID